MKLNTLKYKNDRLNKLHAGYNFKINHSLQKHIINLKSEMYLVFDPVNLIVKKKQNRLSSLSWEISQ